jgi:hypothetical protein
MSGLYDFCNLNRADVKFFSGTLDNQFLSGRISSEQLSIPQSPL